MTGVWFGDLSLSAHLFLSSETTVRKAVTPILRMTLITLRKDITKTTNDTNRCTKRLRMEMRR